MATTVNVNTPNNVTVGQINVSTQKASLEAEYKALVTAINNELTDVTSFTLQGAVFTKAALVARFQSRIDAAEKTKTARTALHTLVATEQELQKEIAPLRMAFKQFLNSRYGKNSPELQKYGFLQAKKPQRTVVGKATAIAKNAATRVARGTKGKKQKSKIKGQPSGVTQPPAPVASPTAVAPPAVAAPPLAQPPPVSSGVTPVVAVKAPGGNS
jgi:hypothetical protein